MSKMTGLDVAELCSRAAFRMGLEACDPPGAATATPPHGGRSDRPAHQAVPGAGRESAAPNTWSPEQDAALLAMHAGGMSAADMAREIDFPAEDIQQRLIWLLMPKPHARSA